MGLILASTGLIQHTNFSGSLSWLDKRQSGAIPINKYGLTSLADIQCAPRDWTFQGSNNASNWDVLDTQTDITFGSSETKYFNISEASEYRYYRIVITDNNGGANTEIGELQLYIDSSSNLVIQMTSNSTPSPFVASASSELSGTYSAWKAFDHNLTGSNWAMVGSSGWLSFDFGAPTITGGAISSGSKYQYGYFISSDALDIEDDFVVRTRGQYSNPHTSLDCTHMICLWDSADAPKVAQQTFTGHEKSNIRCDANNPGNGCYGVFKAYTDAWAMQAHALSTDYVFEVKHSYTDGKDYIVMRNSDLSVKYSGDGTYYLDNDPHLAFGDFYDDDVACDMDFEYAQIFKSLSIVVTGLTSGQYVTVTDSNDSVKASGTATGSSLAIDCAAIGDFPFNGKVKVYDEEGGYLLATCVNSTIYGGDEYEYVPTYPAEAIGQTTRTVLSSAPTLPRTLSHDSHVSLNLWNKDRTRDYGNIDGEVRNVVMKTLDPGGDGPLSFEMPGRDANEFYQDIQQGNILVASYEGREVWGGFVYAPKGGSEGVSIRADGIISRLKRIRMNVNVPPGPGSLYIINYILTHDAINLASGNINSEDFSFPYGIDIGSTCPISEIMEKINRPNAYHWGLRGWKLDFYPHTEKAFYYVHAEDCVDPDDIEFTFDNFVNYLWYTWTEEGVTKTEAVWDEASIKKWDRWDDEVTIDGECSPDEAKARALVILNESCKMRPKTNIVTSKVYIDNDTREIPLPLVRAEKPLCLVGKFSGAQSVLNSDRINELSTFRMVGTSLDCDNGLITLSPGQLGSRADIDMARREAMTLTDTGAA